MEWNDGNNGVGDKNNISVNVKQRAIEIKASGAWSTIVRRSDTTFSLTCSGICDADIGNLQFEGYYTDLENKERSVGVAPQLNSDNTQITITLPCITFEF